WSQRRLTKRRIDLRPNELRRWATLNLCRLGSLLLRMAPPRLENRLARCELPNMSRWKTPGDPGMTCYVPAKRGKKRRLISVPSKPGN
ncbi:hypothetical protein M514_09631, partial [Trichuris suis]